MKEKNCLESRATVATVTRIFVCHTWCCTIGWKSRVSLEGKESLARGKGVFCEEESEGSLTAKAWY